MMLFGQHLLVIQPQSRALGHRCSCRTRVCSASCVGALHPFFRAGRRLYLRCMAHQCWRPTSTVDFFWFLVFGFSFRDKPGRKCERITPELRQESIAEKYWTALLFARRGCQLQQRPPCFCRAFRAFARIHYYGTSTYIVIFLDSSCFRGALEALRGPTGWTLDVYCFLCWRICRQRTDS